MTLTIKDLWATLSPAKIIKEISGAILALGGYYIASSVLSATGQMAFFAPFVAGMYWVMIFLVFLSWVMASLKSALPALLLLISGICLPFFGYQGAAVTAYSVYFGVASTILFGLGWRLKLNWSVTK